MNINGRLITTLVGTMLSVFIATAYDASGEMHQVYRTDFTSPPGWVVSDSTRYGWDAGKQAFHSKRININAGGTHAYYNLDFPMGGQSFRLEWDIIPLSVAYACDIRFGIFDTDLDSDSGGSFAFVAFTREDRGRTMYLQAADQTGKPKSTFSVPTQYSEGKWYHVILSYDSTTEQMRAQISDRDSGSTVSSLTLNNIGPFADDMNLIGTSDHRPGRYQVPGAEANGYYDNVVFYADTPMPTATTAMIIHLKNGEKINYSLTDIDKITYITTQKTSGVDLRAEIASFIQKTGLDPQSSFAKKLTKLAIEKLNPLESSAELQKDLATLMKSLLDKQ